MFMDMNPSWKALLAMLGAVVFQPMQGGISMCVVKQENKCSLKHCVAGTWMKQHSEKIG